MTLWVKRRVPVKVEFLHTSGEMRTLEGLVRYEMGDALMTGSAGEQWPITRSRFEATYEPVSPGVLGEDGFYVKKPIPVEATQVREELVVSLGDRRGVLHAKVGDWIVTAPDGSQWVVADSIFKQTYQGVDQ